MRKLIMLVTVLSLVGTGCGGAADEGSGTTSPGAVTTAETAATPAPDVDDTPATTEAAGTPDDEQPAFRPENCPELMALLRDASAAMASMGGAGGPGSPFEYSAGYFQELADRAPAEIKEDMEIFAAALEDFYQAVEETGLDFTDPASIASMDPADLEKLEQAAAVMETPEVEEANNNIQAFFERECS